MAGPDDEVDGGPTRPDIGAEEDAATGASTAMSRPPPGPPSGPAPPVVRRRRIVLLLGGALGLGVVVGGGAALATGGDRPSVRAGPVVSSTTSTTAASTTTTTTTTTLPEPSTTAPPAAPPSTAAAPTLTPSITSFTAEPSTPNCAQGATGVGLALRWSTQNADAATLSVDGRGLGRFAGGAGSVTVNFACPGPHTYELVATSGARSATKSLTIRASSNSSNAAPAMSPDGQ